MSDARPVTPVTGQDYVLDSSALLAWLRREPGADVVAPRLASAVISTANWSETWQKLAQNGVDADLATRRLTTLGVRVEPLTVEDAVTAARLWATTHHAGLSLGDRCCLALARRLDTPVLTTDRAWTRLDLDIHIELAR